MSARSRGAAMFASAASKLLRSSLASAGTVPALRIRSFAAANSSWLIAPWSRSLVIRSSAAAAPLPTPIVRAGAGVGVGAVVGVELRAIVGVGVPAVAGAGVRAIAGVGVGAVVGVRAIVGVGVRATVEVGAGFAALGFGRGAAFVRRRD